MDVYTYAYLWFYTPPLWSDEGGIPDAVGRRAVSGARQPPHSCVPHRPAMDPLASSPDLGESTCFRSGAARPYRCLGRFELWRQRYRSAGTNSQFAPSPNGLVANRTAPDLFPFWMSTSSSSNWFQVRLRKPRKSRMKNDVRGHRPLGLAVKLSQSCTRDPCGSHGAAKSRRSRPRAVWPPEVMTSGLSAHAPRSRPRNPGGRMWRVHRLLGSRFVRLLAAPLTGSAGSSTKFHQVWFHSFPFVLVPILVPPDSDALPTNLRSNRNSAGYGSSASQIWFYQFWLRLFRGFHIQFRKTSVAGHGSSSPAPSSSGSAFCATRSPVGLKVLTAAARAPD